MKKLILIMAVLLTAACAFAAQSVQEVLASLNKLNSYTADFIQKTDIEGFGSDTYSGKLYIKNRNIALWDYQKPYRQYYLIDTKSLQFYDSENKQLIKQKIDPSTNEFMRLMMDPSSMRKNFNVSYNQTAGKLGVIPINQKSGISPILFTIKDGVITALSTKDQNGNNTTILFTNIKTNPDIPDEVFQPSVPKGTEVFNQ